MHACACLHAHARQRIHGQAATLRFTRAYCTARLSSNPPSCCPRRQPVRGVGGVGGGEQTGSRAARIPIEAAVTATTLVAADGALVACNERRAKVFERPEIPQSTRSIVGAGMPRRSIFTSGSSSSSSSSTGVVCGSSVVVRRQQAAHTGHHGHDRRQGDEDAQDGHDDGRTAQTCACTASCRSRNGRHSNEHTRKAHKMAVHWACRHHRGSRRTKSRPPPRTRNIACRRTRVHADARRRPRTPVSGSANKGTNQVTRATRRRAMRTGRACPCVSSAPTRLRGPRPRPRRKTTRRSPTGWTR
jgi:hypothetical protein